MIEYEEQWVVNVADMTAAGFPRQFLQNGHSDSHSHMQPFQGIYWEYTSRGTAACVNMTRAGIVALECV